VPGTLVILDLLGILVVALAGGLVAVGKQRPTYPW
jgi:hypothetical protein